MPEEGRRSLYFDIRCSNLKILSADKIQYARFENDPPVESKVTTFPEMWQDFQNLYHVSQVFVDSIVIEELGGVIVGTTIGQ